MKKFTLLLALVAMVAAGCGDDDSGTNDTGAQDAETPLVVVTTTILGDIVGNIAGDGARVEVLMPLGADPHAYQASAQQAALMRDADLIVANGIGLEEGLIDVIEQVEAEGIAVLELGPAVDPVPFVGPTGHDHEDEGEAHEDEGDDHDHDGGLDAHVWMDPVRMQQAAALIADRLAAIGVSGAGERGAAYAGELAELSASIEASIASIPEENRKLVTNHFAYGYYAERYGLEMLGTVIPAATTEAETSAAQFAELVEIIEHEGVPAIFGSTSEPVELAEAIAAEVGQPVEVVQLYTGSLGDTGSGAETYIDMMQASTDAIVAALG